MATYYAVYDRSGPREKWAFCSTYTDHNEALDRLRYEAASVYRQVDSSWTEQEDTLIYLDSTRLKTKSGYEMKLEPTQVDEPAPHTSVDRLCNYCDRPLSDHVAKESSSAAVS